MSTEERQVEQIKQMQVDQVIRLGVPRLLGISETDYRVCVPDIPSQPPGNHGKRFSIPVLVDPRLTLGQCARIAGITERLSGTPGAFLLQAHECVDLSAQPYWIWCNVVNKGLLGAIEMEQVGSRWLSATEIIYFIFAIRFFSLLEFSSMFTSAITQYAEQTGRTRYVVLEKNAKSTVVEGLGIGWALEQQRRENPGSLFQLYSYPILPFLDEPNNPVRCAWPPRFDWSSVPEPEEKKGWRFWRR